MSVLLNIFRECRRYGRVLFSRIYRCEIASHGYPKKNVLYVDKMLPIKQLFPIINIINVYEQNLNKKLSKLIKVPPFT